MGCTGWVAGCDAPPDDGDSAPTGNADASSSGPSGEESSGETAASESAEGASESGPSEETPPVECGDTTCAPGELCHTGALTCNYTPCADGEPAVWRGGEKTCVAFPSACEASEGIEAETCVIRQLCGDAILSTFSEGQVRCMSHNLDCFC